MKLPNLHWAGLNNYLIAGVLAGMVVSKIVKQDTFSLSVVSCFFKFFSCTKGPGISRVFLIFFEREGLNRFS